MFRGVQPFYDRLHFNRFPFKSANPVRTINIVRR